ncbi:unnamed protein product [Staurois parvus]|uniref:Uncharacterized protein n=1 Tax=Staurois parvus TaxID=386267 RepID=A0ABN9DHA8_9NEOB|nr:unnamed protein product [Staurois parvus]
MTDARWFSRSGRTSYTVLPFSPRMCGSRSAAIGSALCPTDTADHRCTEGAEDVGSVM